MDRAANSVGADSELISGMREAGAWPRERLGWICPPPLLPEVLSEIDANLVSFYGEKGGHMEVGQVWSFIRQ